MEDCDACPAGVVCYAQETTAAAHSQAPALEGKQLGSSCECLPSVRNPGLAYWPYVFSWWQSYFFIPGNCLPLLPTSILSRRSISMGTNVLSASRISIISLV